MPPSSVARIRFSSQELRLTQSGYEATEIYRVPKTIASNLLAAMKAPGVPVRNAQLVMPDGTKIYAFAKEFSVTTPAESENVFIVTVEYGEVQPRRFLTGQNKFVDWSLGMTSVHSDVSVTGKWVGSRVSWNATGTAREVPQIPLPEVQIGYEQMIPTFEFQIRSPRSTSWDPLTVNSLRGHVNNGTVILNDNGRIYSFEAGLLLFLGATANPLGDGTNAYAITYNFMAGYRKVEGSLTIYVDDTNTVAAQNTSRVIPMRYGIWPRYNAITEVDSDGIRQVRDQIPVAWSRFVALPEANFALLRI